MAKIALIWELGVGLGHLGWLKIVGEALIARGHSVVAVVREPQRAEPLLAGTGMQLQATPKSAVSASIQFPVTGGYAHILANNDFSDLSRLKAKTRAWQSIVAQIGPDAVIVDHSPAALLALRNTGVRSFNLGTGFFCPPDCFPLPIWSQIPAASNLLIQLELQLLANVNQVLAIDQRPPLQQLSNLFNGPTQMILTTYPELDHFGARLGARYWGHWSLRSSRRPRWPEASGPRIYAYLKPFPAVEAMLHFLVQSRLPTLIVSDGLPADLTARYTCRTLGFDRAVDLCTAAAECEFAILNANHGTLAQMLLGGKPCMLIPLTAEQLLLAEKARQLGAARVALRTRTAEIIAGIEALVKDRGACKIKADHFAKHYREWPLPQNAAPLVLAIEELIGRSN